jgi:hypothetical protein
MANVRKMAHDRVAVVEVDAVAMVSAQLLLMRASRRRPQKALSRGSTMRHVMHRQA